jgi:hypothetical protein
LSKWVLSAENHVKAENSACYRPPRKAAESLEFWNPYQAK